MLSEHVADDTAIYLGSQTIDTLNIYSNQDLERLAEWLEDNNLVLNVAKTKFLLFTSQRHKERNCKLSLMLLGREISCVTAFKYLGVAFDNFMAWKAQADHVCKKVACRVGILGRIRGFLTKEVSILVQISLGVVCYNKTRIDYSVCNIDRRV